MIYLLIVVGLFLVSFYLMEVHHARERRELYQRIQAPQLAVNEMIAEQITDPLETYVPIDDDVAYSEYKST